LREQIHQHRESDVDVLVAMDADIGELVAFSHERHDVPAVHAPVRVWRVAPQLDVTVSDTDAFDAWRAGTAQCSLRGTYTPKSRRDVACHCCGTDGGNDAAR